MTVAPSRPWVLVGQPRPDAAIRLFCLPFAGGGASTFRQWPDILPPDIEVAAVQLPGRETRLNEAPFTSMPELVGALAEGLLPRLDAPFAVFGHSMGALVGYELTRYLETTQRLVPVRLLVSGHGAPGSKRERPPVHDVDDDRFIDELRRLDGTPPEVLEHPQLMRLLLPVLRADFRVCETYEPRDAVPVSCPISAYGGLDDPLARRDVLEAWRGFTRRDFVLRFLPGDHFFLQQRPDLLLRALATDLLFDSP